MSRLAVAEQSRAEQMSSQQRPLPPPLPPPPYPPRFFKNKSAPLKVILIKLSTALQLVSLRQLGTWKA